LLYEGKELLLVPKWIVRKNLEDMSNKEVVSNYFKPAKHKKTIEYTKEHSNVLEEYHEHVIKCYKKKGNRITDEKLDKIIYKK